MNKVLFLIGFVYALNSFAQNDYPKVQIPNSQVRNIKSKIVVNQEYELQILLPNSYTSVAKTYPVIYVMDAQWDFPLVKSIYGQLYYDGFIPEAIIVGVTWAGNKPNADSLRVRDYTPSKGNRPQGGGADMFLTFISNELFPFIESNYRADNHTRTIMGCSLGGLLSLTSLFTRPELFSNYIIASPAIGWDNGKIYKIEEQYYKLDGKNNKKVYLTIGDVEFSKPEFEKFDSLVAERKYSSFEMKSKVLENTGHSGSKSETYSRGLQYVFERPKLKLNDEILNKYTGVYTASNKTSVEIKNENGHLVLNDGSKVYRLYASSDRDFYSEAEFLNVSFFININGFKLERYGSAMLYKQ